jgi:hypothetical protein
MSHARSARRTRNLAKRAEASNARARGSRAHRPAKPTSVSNVNMGNWELRVGTSRRPHRASFTITALGPCAVGRASGAVVAGAAVRRPNTART